MPSVVDEVFAAHEARIKMKQFPDEEDTDAIIDEYIVNHWHAQFEARAKEFCFADQNDTDGLFKSAKNATEMVLASGRFAKGMYRLIQSGNTKIKSDKKYQRVEAMYDKCKTLLIKNGFKSAENMMTFEKTRQEARRIYNESGNKWTVFVKRLLNEVFTNWKQHGVFEEIMKRIDLTHTPTP